MVITVNQEASRRMALVLHEALMGLLRERAGFGFNLTDIDFLGE